MKKKEKTTQLVLRERWIKDDTEYFGGVMKFKMVYYFLFSIYLSILSILLIGATLPVFAQANSWKWIAYGDTRSNDSIHRDVLQSMMNNTTDYKFIINVGDVVSDGVVKSQWDTWQKACDDVLGGTGQDQVPPKYMAVPGNHDQTEKTNGLINWNTYLSGQVQQYGNDGKYFVFDYENARFIIMDSDKSPVYAEQYTMLLNAIENNPKTWLFAVWHHPIFDFGPKSYEDFLHDMWGVSLYGAGCDIMFMGHSHYYVRSKKLELNGEMNPPVDSINGTVHVVTGNGGAPAYQININEDNNGYMVESYTTQYGYTELTVGEDTLRLRHYLRTGTLFDEEYYTPNFKSPVSVVEKNDNAGIPADYIVNQNYPNPFNPETTIQFSLPTDCKVTIKIYDISGKIVNTIVNSYLQKGIHQFSWSGKNSEGLISPSGVYFYQMKTDFYESTKKMIKLQ